LTEQHEITILKTIFVVHYFHGQIQTWSCLEEEGDLLSNKNIFRCYRFKTNQYKLIQINHINMKKKFKFNFATKIDPNLFCNQGISDPKKKIRTIKEKVNQSLM